MEKPSYQRILLKISGEGLAGEPGRGIDFAFVREVGQVIKACVAQGVQVGLVIGGGNFWRGAKDGGGNMERTRADQMGMLATVINSLAVQDVLEQIGQPARVLTSIPMGPVGQITSRAAAEEHFAAGRVVIFAGGTGNPYFSTDTAAVLRAAEIMTLAAIRTMDQPAVIAKAREELKQKNGGSYHCPLPDYVTPPIGRY